MIKGVGLDLCEIARMDRLKDDERFLRRYFTEGEIEYIRQKKRAGAQSMAGLFAAKEAFSKAMGTGIVFDLREAEITHDEHGKPILRLRGKTAEMAGTDRFMLSVTHEGDMAAAICIREGFNAAEMQEMP